MRRQRGVALIIALLALALAVMIAASLLDRGEVVQGRWRDGWRGEQSWQLLRGLEAWAEQGLLADARATGSVDALDEAWAQPMAPVEIPGARISGRLRDLGGCFNVNSLVKLGVADEPAVRRLQRLLRGLQLPPVLAEQAVDYLDADAQPRQQGGEDGLYLGQRPSTRAANQRLVHASELRRLPAMDDTAWNKLQPLLCALPEDHRLNLNTAVPELWLTLDDGMTLAQARRLARSRGQAYPDLAAVQAALQREGLAVADLTPYAVGSRYFLAQARIDADGIEFAYQSLLQRLPQEVRVIARARGGEFATPLP
jgi:general secretion pathway protein K